MFRQHHYLNHNLNKSAHCYVATIDDKPVAFCAVLHFPHPKVKNIKRIHRLVVLPDYQGIGLGGRFLDYIAVLYIKQKYQARIVTSTPAMIYSLKNNKKWALVDFGRKTGNHSGIAGMKGSRNRMTTSWKYGGK